jgi:hypothetical protein
MADTQFPIVMEEVTDPEGLAKVEAQREHSRAMSPQKRFC